MNYDFWRDSLAGKNPPIVNEDPQPGFYRMKRNGGWVPVAVWIDIRRNDGLCFKIGNEVVDENTGIERWHWYAPNPISEIEYRRVDGGLCWSDDDPTVAELDKSAPIAKRIDAALNGVTNYEKIESDEQSVRAAGLRNLLLGLHKEVDSLRAEEKDPYLQAAKHVDSMWMPLVKKAKAGADKVRTAMEAWEDLKRSSKSENLPPVAEQIRPTLGKAASVGTYLAVTEVDADKLIAALKPLPEWRVVMDCLTELAQKLVKDGIVLDGVTVEHKTRIK